MQRTIQFSLHCTLVLLAITGCTTNVPAPVVDRSTRPPLVQPDPRALPPVVVAADTPVAVQPGNTAGSQFHVVQRGETLYGIARSNGVDVNALTAWNSLIAGAALREGQVLRLSPPVSAAPAMAASGTTVTPIPSSGVIQGQPLPPGVAPPILPSVVATLPPAAVGAPVLSPVVTPVEAPLKREPKSQRLPYSDAALAAMQRGDAQGLSSQSVATSPDARLATGPAAAASAPTAASASTTASAAPPASVSVIEIEIKPGNSVDRDGIAWTWPTSGKVASKFNDKAPMKGIDIAANAGTAVVAAATGKVIYVGKEPRGYGQMIVVNHAKETVSVYFHTDKVQVKEQQRVLLGQKLAEVADSAGNKMHFEVRRQGRPLDPVSLMPR